MGVPSKGRIQQLLRKHGFMQPKWEEAERYFLTGARYFYEYRRNTRYRPLTTELVEGRVRESLPPIQGLELVGGRLREWSEPSPSRSFRGQGKRPFLPNPKDKGRFSLKGAVRLFLVHVHLCWLIGTNRTPTVGKKPSLKDRCHFERFAKDSMDLLAIGDSVRRLRDFWRYRREEQEKSL